VQNEARVAWRQPIGLATGLALPVLLLAVLAGVFRGAKLGGVSVAQDELPMLIVLVLASIALFGLPTPLATYREQGILRRLSTTPVPPAWVLGAQLAVNVCIAVAGLAILLVTGITGFGVKTPQSVGGLALSVALAAVALFGIGLWITGTAQNAAIAGGLAYLIFFPLTFFAGVFVPLAILPAGVRNVGDWTPLGAAVHALQDAMQTGFPPARFLLVLAGYAVVTGGLAVRFFRWE
jgi:ABC-2 type transport system permease protein